MPLLIPSQRSPDWYSARKGRITASVAAGCLGEHPYMSPQKAWRLITGRETVKENADITAGVEGEPIARRELEIETGLIVEETGFWVHPEHAWLGVSPDGLIPGGLVEIKCPRQIREEPPGYHRIQMQLQMGVVGRENCLYVQWCPPQLKVDEVAFDAHEYERIVAGLKTFFKQYVFSDIEPPRRRKGK